MAAKKKIRTITLDNGEILEVYDASKKVAGDSWFVNIVFKVPIEVKKDHFEEVELQQFNFEAIQNALGKSVAFEVIRERKFILEEKKAELIDHYINDYLKNTYTYIAKPDFPKKFILKKYSEHLKNRLPPGYQH